MKNILCMIGKLFRQQLFSIIALLFTCQISAQVEILQDIEWKTIPLILENPSNLAFSYLDESIYFDFGSDAKRKIASIKNIENSVEIHVLNTTSSAKMPAPSPKHEASLIFVSDCIPVPGIYPENNTLLKSILKRNVEMLYPAFNKNGNLLAFSGKTNNDQYDQLMTFDFKYDNLNTLTKSDRDVHYPRWSPDGKIISYQTNNPKRWYMKEIVLVNWDGSPAMTVSNDTLSLSHASWGKSNTRFVCVGENQNGYWLLIYLINEEKYIELAFSQSIISFPIWSLEGNKIVFVHEPETEKKELILLTIE